jgi:hypothetical protein
MSDIAALPHPIEPLEQRQVQSEKRTVSVAESGKRKRVVVIIGENKVLLCSSIKVTKRKAAIPAFVP